METLFVMRNGKPTPADKEYRVVNLTDANPFNKGKRENLICSFLRTNLPNLSYSVKEITPQVFEISDIYNFRQPMVRIEFHAGQFQNFTPTPKAADGRDDVRRLASLLEHQSVLVLLFNSGEVGVNNLQKQINDLYMQEVYELVNQR